MKFYITLNISHKVADRLIHRGSRIDIRLGEYLSERFASGDHGQGVSGIYIGLICLDPKTKIPSKDSETGQIIKIRYSNAKRILELETTLNYGDVLNTRGNQIIDIIAKAILESYNEILNLAIKDFDVNRFFIDLRTYLSDRTWLDTPYQEKEFIYSLPKHTGRKSFADSEKMGLEAFWRIVYEAKSDSSGNFNDQIEILISRLKDLEGEEIVGFECTLREQLIRANHYNVMATQKIVEGRVTDDSFLYFRCKLILYGKKTFEMAIVNPNEIEERIDPVANGEPLLTVADKAFGLKFGNHSTKVFPKEHAMEVIDYDSEEFIIEGTDWSDREIAQKFSKLLSLYS